MTFPTINPTTTDSWKKLDAHYKEQSKTHLKELFANDPQRFKKFSLSFENILVDFSKNRINDNTLDLLLSLAEECGLKDAIKAMYAGEKINYTEDRSVLHIALR